MMRGHEAGADAGGGSTMARTSFTRAEAQAKVGRQVRPRVALAEIPPRASGTIIGVERVIDGYDPEALWM
jgi:hypothetical protein